MIISILFLYRTKCYTGHYGPAKNEAGFSLFNIIFLVINVCEAGTA